MYQRFFLKNKIDEKDDEIIISDIEQAHQINRVLRRKIKDRIIILDNSGLEFECEIKQVTEKLILLKILERRENKNEPNIIVSLYQSLPNPLALQPLYTFQHPDYPLSIQI